MPKALTLSIVIPCWNEEARLEACLEAIAAQSIAPLEVIMVDNNSTDRSIGIAEEYGLVRIVREERQGVVFARNAGFDAARGDIIGRIDADSKIPKYWVRHVLDFYSRPENRHKAWSCSGDFADVRLPHLASSVYRTLAFKFSHLLTGHYTLWGSSMALPKQLWRQVKSKTCARTDIHEDLDLAIHIATLDGNAVFFDKRMTVSASLRGVYLSRQEVWERLQWWPRALRAHGYHSWPIVWWFGTLMIYWLWPLHFVIDWLARRFGRPPLKH